MKVRQLSDSLELAYGEGRTHNLLTVFSHWMKKLFDSPKTEYATSDANDIAALRKLAKMRIVEVSESGGKLTARLTKEGKDLYWDFMAKGYYGTSEGI